MRFISGPRQCGKTTLAREKLKAEKTEQLYYLWDERSVRNHYRDNELFFTQDSPPIQTKQWVCFDEIHKMPKWKNILKGIFDSSDNHYHFIITGSAKLSVIKKAGDSLAGRYFTFHLMPLTLMEVTKESPDEPAVPDSAENFIELKLSSKSSHHEQMKDLLEYSGFPEPFISQSKIFHSKWAENYIDTVIKEDIGALTRIIDREYLSELYRILPEMTGSPISESSLASHIQVSPPTIKNYLKKLEDFYLIFLLKPYSKNIKRSLLRASKCYLYDWTRNKEESFQFENYIAMELKTRINLWNDRMGEKFDLFYIRNKQKEETDFLISKKDKPWMLIETKLKDQTIAHHHFSNAFTLGNIPFVQLCKEPGIASIQKKGFFRISANTFFT
ncbi:MAG: ATP-binding protein [Candidatus Aureabacteria bacterium]|nr:ATP-binding protein [Candidatus Auribacterota bacterium]